MSGNRRIVSFGEILYDVFPDRSRLGGAPFNLAVHLHRLGADVDMISALGSDRSGRDARKRLLAEGVGGAFVAEVPYPTGRVEIRLDEQGLPSYSFGVDCAYDHIPLPESPISAVDLFCFGTLAQRGAESAETLRRLLERFDCRRFCDVNLRQNFYSRSILETSLAAADWVKLNSEELPVLADCFRLPERLDALAERFQLDTVIRTLGPDGCEVYSNGETLFSPSFPAKVASTVGAGDAFSAAFIMRRLDGASLKEAAEAGNRLASLVTELPGAF